MTCVRDTPESGRLFVPWPIEGHGMPIVGTATLAERTAPYMLAVELARGKLNDIRNQLSDWVQMGLRSTPELDEALAEAQHAFVRCATSTDQPDACTDGRPSLAAVGLAGRRSADRSLHRPDPPEPAGRRRPGSRRTWAASWTVLPRNCRRRSTGRARSTRATWASRGSRWRPRRASTAGTCSTPSWPGAARRA